MSWNELIDELKDKMTLTRLAKVGLFQKLPNDEDNPIFSECSDEIYLHRAVLDRALVDSFSQSKKIRGDIESWLYIDNPDFIDACDRALLDPKLVLACFKVMKKILKGKNAKFRKFGRRSEYKSD